MSVPVPRHQPLRFTAARTVLGLELLGLALGSITFAADPLGFPDPALALYGIGFMALVVLIAHAVPALRARARLAHLIEVVALFLYATLLTLSTGATNSPFIALYALPLFVAALAWKVWQVAALALVTVGLTLVQSGFLDAMNDMHLPTTVMVLLDALAPAAAAALIMAAWRQHIAALEAQARQAALTGEARERQRPARVKLTAVPSHSKREIADAGRPRAVE